MQRVLFILATLLFGSGIAANAQETYRLDTAITYLGSKDANADAYRQQMCKLDIYYPTNTKDFPTVVWFHGGGLTGGRRDLPKELTEKGIAVITAEYRLYPKASCPAYIEDAAAATAWAFENIAKYGGNPSKIYISGHSAGGYLSMMVGMQPQWLAKYGIDNQQIAGLIPLSGQAITHFTIRREQGIDAKQPTIDAYAPLYHVSKDIAPLHLITGDRNIELFGRYEENAYLWRMMKEVGHPSTYLYELEGFDHGDMVAPGATLLVKIIKKQENSK